MNKKELLESFKLDLKAAKELREAIKSNPALYAAKSALKKYQTERMKATHKNLLENEETRGAAMFFLAEVYSDKDLTKRDQDLTSLTPIIEKTFPEKTLTTIALAMELDRLTENLDLQMAMRLGDEFTDEEYMEAFKTIGTKEDRFRQLEMIQILGDSLASIVQVRGLFTFVKMMRKPAKLAGLEEIHDFIEQGFGLFKDTKDPKAFIAGIIEKERQIMEEIYLPVNA